MTATQNKANPPKFNIYRDGRQGIKLWDEHDNFLSDAKYEQVFALFKAAPEMLEALESVIPYMEQAEKAGLVGHEGCHWPVEVVRAVISRARGGE